MNKYFVEKTIFYETLIHRILLQRNFQSFILNHKESNLTEKFYIAKFMLSFPRILYFKDYFQIYIYVYVYLSCIYIYTSEFAHLYHTFIFLSFINVHVKTQSVFLLRGCFVCMFFFFPSVFLRITRRKMYVRDTMYSVKANILFPSYFWIGTG